MAREFGSICRAGNASRQVSLHLWHGPTRSREIPQKRTLARTRGCVTLRRRGEPSVDGVQGKFKSRGDVCAAGSFDIKRLMDINCYKVLGT